MPSGHLNRNSNWRVFFVYAPSSKTTCKVETGKKQERPVRAQVRPSQTGISEDERLREFFQGHKKPGRSLVVAAEVLPRG